MDTHAIYLARRAARLRRQIAATTRTRAATRAAEAIRRTTPGDMVLHALAGAERARAHAALDAWLDAVQAERALYANDSADL